MVEAEVEVDPQEDLILVDSKIKGQEFIKEKVVLEDPQKEEASDLLEDSPTVNRYDNVLILFLLGNYSFYFSH